MFKGARKGFSKNSVTVYSLAAATPREKRILIDIMTRMFECLHQQWVGVIF